MPTTFERSLIAHDRRGVVVTIPAGWMSIHYLKAGDRVQLEVDHDLVIRPYRTGKRRARNLVRVIGKKTGSYSYRLAVPPSWLRRRGLQLGDRVQLEVDHDLTIRPAPSHGSRRRHG